jgi:hypothetical protein
MKRSGICASSFEGDGRSTEGRKIMATLDPDILNKLLNLGEGFARHHLVKKKGAMLEPFYTLVTPGKDPPFTFVPCDFSNDDMKDMTIAAIHTISRELDAAAVLFVAESWMLILPAPKEGEPEITLDDAPRPSLSPDRIEVVILVASDGMTTKSRNLRIVRDRRTKTKRVIALHRDKDFDGEPMCRMTDGVIQPKVVN